MAKDVDWVVRPKRNPVREVSNISNMQGEIAEIVWRLNFVLIAVDVEQPAKRANCEDGEARG